MKTETGKTIPYVPTPYQVEFHIDSLNIKGTKATDILFEKARGISFTMCSCIELIMSASKFSNITFPIIAQRFDSAKGILHVAQWLIKNSNRIEENGIVIDLRDGIIMTETEIRFANGSTIKPYPSGSASDAVRSLRLVRALLDEFAYQSRDEELLAAVQDAMIGEHAQIIIGSTPCGVNNKFYDLVKNPIGFKTFRLPAFDETKFDINKTIYEQKLIPIAPWLDLEKLETKRQRDEHIFMQEQMCSFLDDSTSFISLLLIRSSEITELVNFLHRIEDNPGFIYETQNPLYMGIDVARHHDLTAITIFEKTFDEENNRYNMVQRYINFIKNEDLPKQQKVIERLLTQFPQVVKVRIDMTGIGLGLYEYLKRNKGSMIEGIHFAQRVKTSQYGITTSIVERMAVHMKNMMQDGKVNLIVDELQEKHLNDVDYNFKATRRGGLGHGDMFYAIGLALLPENYKYPEPRAMVITKPTEDRLPVLEAPAHYDRVNKLQNMTWEDKFKYLKKI